MTNDNLTFNIINIMHDLSDESVAHIIIETCVSWDTRFYKNKLVN